MNAPRPGEILVGKYRVEKVLGNGGMGVVVSARHLQLDESVAIKFLLPSLAAQQTQVARFLREGKAAVKIKSEHVARVIDVGTLDDTGAPYMVMELLDGSDLAELLRKESRIPVDEAVLFVMQACEALAEAHLLGIVHRDLKPANLFLTARADGSPCIKVLDFGISKLRDGAMEGAALTNTNGMMGSPLYMSPEQLRDPKNVDPRSDIWAFGVILFELVTGNRPFEADSIPQLIMRVIADPAPSIVPLLADVPAGFDDVVSRCLLKDPTQRFGDVHELARALAPFGPPDESARSVERIARVIAGDKAAGPRRSRTGSTLRNPSDLSGSNPQA
ncbi:MAG: serine/threonine-protein kinase, partial [Polyangiales bacterium]